MLGLQVVSKLTWAAFYWKDIRKVNAASEHSQTTGKNEYQNLGKLFEY